MHVMGTTTVKSLIETGTEYLKRGGIPDAEREARHLACHITGSNLAGLFLRYTEEVSSDTAGVYLEMVSRRMKREPLQYITGIQEFWGLSFKVTGDVFIPRPETEIVVEEAIKVIRNIEGRRPLVVDMCTGCGCIGISIARECGAVVYGVDISGRALSVAEENACMNGVVDRMVFLEGDLFSPLTPPEGGFDLLVSNPPYIPEGDMDGLSPEVRDYEPRIALCGGEDGLEIIRRILKDAPMYVRSGGYIIFEIGYGQAEGVRRIVEDRGGFESMDIRRDYSGIERVVSLRLS